MQRIAMADLNNTQSESEAYRRIAAPPRFLLEMITRAATFIARDVDNELTPGNIGALRAFALVVWGKDAWREELAAAEEYHPTPNRPRYPYRKVGLARLMGVFEQLREVDVELAEAFRLSQGPYLSTLEIMSFREFSG